MINLSKHIEILLLSNDCVIVPGFGGFMAHHIDARKDLSDGSFLPPIRSIGFNPKLTLNDSLLAQSYVEAYDMSYPEAVMRIEDEVRELRQRIAKDGGYEFTDIGFIRLNGDGNYEFSPCEAGIVSPSLYGLGSFRMKTLADIKDGLRTSIIEAQQVLQPNRENASSLNTALKTKEPDSEKIHSARIIALWRNLAVACFAVIIFMLIPSPLVNDSQLAGSSINTALLERVLPKDITIGQNKVAEAVMSNGTKGMTDGKKVSSKAKDINKEKASQKECFSIVLASRVTKKNAEAYVNNLKSRGFADAFVYKDDHIKVLFGHYVTRSAATKALNSLNNKDEFAGAWVTEVNL